VIRAQRDPERLVPSVRAAVAAVDESVALYMVITMPRLVDAELASDRLTMFLLVSFAGVALVLAAIGVFGVFASDVTRRRREIGVRLALGAAEGGIVRLLLTASLRRAAVGVGVGWILAVLLGRGMKGMLFGVTVLDPVSFGTAGAAAIGLASLATLLPVWEALRSSPLDALREQ